MKKAGNTEDEFDERIEIDLVAAANKAFERVLNSAEGMTEAHDWNLMVLGQIKLSEALVADDEVHPHLKLVDYTSPKLKTCERLLGEVQQQAETIRSLRMEKARLSGCDMSEDDETLVFEEPPKGDDPGLTLRAVRGYMKAWLDGDRDGMSKWLRRLGDIKLQEHIWPIAKLKAVLQLRAASTEMVQALQREVDELKAGKSGMQGG